MQKEHTNCRPQSTHLLCDRVGALLEEGILALRNLSGLLAAERLHVVVLVPLLEGRSIDLCVEKSDVHMSKRTKHMISIRNDQSI